MTVISSNVETGSGLGIVGVASTLGEQRYDLASLVKRGLLCEHRATEIAENGSGQYYRSDDADSETLAMASIKDLLLRHGIDPGAVSHLVFTSTVFETTAYYPGLVAQRLAAAAGCCNAQVFALQHAYCVSPFVALKVLQANLAARSEDSPPFLAILVCADTIGPVVEHLRAIDTLGLHSDGSAAVLLADHGPRHMIKGIEITMNASRYRGQQLDGHIQNDPLFFVFLAKTLKALFNKSGLEPGDELTLCANNLNLKAWHHIAKLFRIPEPRLLFNQSTGHVFGADPFINLATLDQAGDAPARTILAASGVGGAFAGAFLERVAR